MRIEEFLCEWHAYNERETPLFPSEAAHDSERTYTPLHIFSNKCEENILNISL